MSLGSRVVLAAVVLAGVSACGSSTTDPSPPPGIVGPPTLAACPANISLAGAPAIGESVAYVMPVPQGGTPPVTTTCAPASGSTFPIGSTTVTCTAKDAISRSAVCSFTVSVTSATLSAMNFMAFGDSITAGENGSLDPNSPLPTQAFPMCSTPASSPAAVRRLAALRPQVIDIANAYPTKLLSLLQSRFPSEPFKMDDEGLPGETLAGATGGVVRLARCVQTYRPGVLLLLEGVNDIDSDNGDWTLTTNQAMTIVSLLSQDVSAAVTAGAQFVFVSTILPVRACTPEAPNFDCHTGDPGDPVVTTANNSIDLTNALIRAGLGSATIVDGNAAFKAADPTLLTLVGDDGLHPTPAGNTVLAQTFFSAIVSRIPVTSAARRVKR
jgi:lysophospholipase L1-like esterase